MSNLINNVEQFRFATEAQGLSKGQEAPAIVQMRSMDLLARIGGNIGLSLFSDEKHEVFLATREWTHSTGNVENLGWSVIVEQITGFRFVTPISGRKLREKILPLNLEEAKSARQDRFAVAPMTWWTVRERAASRHADGFWEQDSNELKGRPKTQSFSSHEGALKYAWETAADGYRAWLDSSVYKELRTFPSTPLTLI